MLDAKELDLFKRSLSGDWQSRVRLYRRYFWSDAGIRAKGSVYRSPDDFLHDCFANAMRSGQSSNPDDSLAIWAQSVADWTALERERFQDPDAAGKAGRIRMCAGMEGEEPNQRGRLPAYMPPKSGPQDTLHAHLASLLGEPQFTLLSKRGIEKKSWDDAAAAVARPVNTIGPLVIRAVDRLARFFGAPPPLNDDLEPVFTAIIREDAKTRGSDPEKPRGRVASMNLDPAFYSPTPQLRKIGVSVPAEVRTLTLWEAAMSSTPPAGPLRDHLGRCNYCADVLRALLLMQQALESAPGADYLLCPGGFTLINTPEGEYNALDSHLAECALCREEQAALLDQEAQVEEGQPSAALGMGVKIAIGAAAVLLLAILGYFMLRPSGSQPGAPGTSSTVAAAPAEVPEVKINPRYRDIAETIRVTDIRWLQSVLPQDREVFSHAIDRLQNSDLSDAKLDASGIADHDPGAQMLYAVILYGRNSVSEGYTGMLKAEAMPPRNDFRCWATLQCALMVGDLKVAAREADHLANNPEYAQKAKAQLARAKARG
ncbi:MAG TPA: hypothetical protein VGL72_19420 [Bryobacteraceae bacterium]|jgi:DNA-directed RNA polymerase specialized sigma24 family protein